MKRKSDLTKRAANGNNSGLPLWHKERGILPSNQNAENIIFITSFDTPSGAKYVRRKKELLNQE